MSYYYDLTVIGDGCVVVDLSKGGIVPMEVSRLL